ncbi:HxlR family transcriptional regulator [Clostridium sp. MF28]|uniref:winged helix-turn-helix transcriptional regulator n=1 Tax=Clostridium TaxID=1485 RepID=UPI0003D2E036|nr:MULTISPECIES: helix-turn-helix domain-containing protein [Clostridium]ALB43901.1 transcriptional regulator [Clostridium beijerinckii NRRL B-598]AVK48884.1 HxlR family transcriptional regulator [Clostridium sp. MF28]PSM55444.1 transcriptional regulator [Clostridium diolis]
MSDYMRYNKEFPDDNIYETECPVIYALDILGQKWKLPIMWYLSSKDSTRYNELKRKVKGITNMMLTKSLKELEEHKLIVRTQYETIPPRVEYSLTERGKALLPTLKELYVWGEDQLKLDK